MQQEKRWDPEHYYKHSATQLGHAKDLLSEYQFRGDEQILDIGCGDGKITAALSQHIPHGHITGMDKSAEMIAFANQTFPAASFTNVSFRKKDILDLDETEKYDLIVSFSCLYYVKQQEIALKSIRRALKPSGKILLMLYRKCPDQWLAIDKVVSSKRWRDYFAYFDPGYYEYLPDTYKNLLDQCALGQFTARFTPVEHINFDSKEHLNKFMRGWLPHLQKLPKDKHDEFMQEIVDTYLNQLRVADGRSIKIPFVRLLVY